MEVPVDLNPEQWAAVRATEGPVRVVAGPGTGKTRTLTRRYCHLVADLGIAPANILCVTFTNRAAGEMKNRVRAALGDMDLGLICTFHAFGVQLLKEDSHVLHYPKNFIVLDADDQKQMLAKIFGEMGLTLRDATFRRTLDMLEMKKLKDRPRYTDYIHLMDNEELKARFDRGDRDQRILLRYLYEQKKSFACDFTDLIAFSTYLLEKFPDVRVKWQDRMQYVMVDEFQDIDPEQYKLACLLAGKHKNLFVVGDPDQTIYSWRGADVRLFLDFDQTHPGTKTAALTANYRSTPEILAASAALIARNGQRLPHALNAVRDSGPKPLFNHARRDKDEAAWLFGEIDKLRDAGAALGDIAVLYRAHYLTRTLEERFIEAGLPYKIYSGMEFYGRREIKDVVCYLRMVAAGDDVAFLRTINTPPRKMGKKRLDRLAREAEVQGIALYEAMKRHLDSDWLRGSQAGEYAAAVERVRGARAEMPMGDAMQMLMDLTGYEKWLRLRGDQDRLDNVAELKRSIEMMGEDAEAVFEDFLARAALFTDIDREDGRDAVKLMTAHVAKGMEFPHVFVYGLSEGVFPSRKADTPEAMEEERRLAYVALTRARDRLFLSDSEGVANDGVFKNPSRFVFEIGRERLDYVTELEATPGAAARPGALIDAPRFVAGDRLDHPVFGAGVVAAVNMDKRCYSIRFDALATERSLRFDASLAPEERL